MTSRILVVDLLTRRVDPLLITGMLVCNAHSLTDTSMEAFILRIFRRATATGFVKAFSDDPLALVAGYGRVEKTLRSLYVRKLFLWPRFHEVVRQQLAASQPEVRRSASCRHVFMPISDGIAAVSAPLLCRCEIRGSAVPCGVTSRPLDSIPCLYSMASLPACLPPLRPAPPCACMSYYCMLPSVAPLAVPGRL